MADELNRCVDARDLDACVIYSAGGQLAALMTTLVKKDTHVGAIALLVAPTDLVDAAARRGGLSKAVQDLLNREETVTDEVHAILHQLSPINHVGSTLRSDNN